DASLRTSATEWMRRRTPLKGSLRLAFAALVLALGVVRASFVHAQAASTPSFNCSGATDPIDLAICNDPKLAEADAVMGRLFAAVKVSAFGEGPSNELAAQREWLESRRTCRTPDRRVYPSRERCLSGFYERRNQALAVAAL